MVRRRQLLSTNDEEAQATHVVALASSPVSKSSKRSKKKNTKNLRTSNNNTNNKTHNNNPKEGVHKEMSSSRSEFGKKHSFMTPSKETTNHGHYNGRVDNVIQQTKLCSLRNNDPSEDTIQLLQSEVGKLNALALVMMKRMNLYEQQFEWMMDAKESASLKDLLRRYQEQTEKLQSKESSKQSTKDEKTLQALSLQKHRLGEQEKLTQQWIQLLQNDRDYYKKRLNLTYDEIRSLKVQQERIKKQMSAVAMEHDRRLQRQQQRLLTASESNSAIPSPHEKAGSSAHLVDDMMDSFYKEWVVKQVPPDSDRNRDSYKRESSKKTKKKAKSGECRLY